MGVKFLEDVDPEFAEYIKEIVEGTLKARVFGNRVFEKNGNGYKEVILSETVGRNDPCPCGSGKKYKKCCYS